MNLELNSEKETLVVANGETIEEGGSTKQLEIIEKKDLPTREDLGFNDKSKKLTFKRWIALLIACAVATGFFLYVWSQAPRGIEIESIRDGNIDSITMKFVIRDLHGYQGKDLDLGIEYNKIVESNLFSEQEIKTGEYIVNIPAGALQRGENQIQLKLYANKGEPIDSSNVTKFIAR